MIIKEHLSFDDTATLKKDELRNINYSLETIQMASEACQLLSHTVNCTDFMDQTLEDGLDDRTKVMVQRSLAATLNLISRVIDTVEDKITEQIEQNICFANKDIDALYSEHFDRRLSNKKSKFPGASKRKISEDFDYALPVSGHDGGDGKG